MNSLMFLPDKIRRMICKEAGRTLTCGAKTNLIVNNEHGQFPFCSSCITDEELRCVSSGSQDREGSLECRGVRIIGASGKDYRIGLPAVDISGVYTKDHYQKIRKQGYEVFKMASRISLGDLFGVALVVYDDDRYSIFGTGYTEQFPVGSKILLCKLSFELVDDRFEPANPRSETIEEFDRLRRSSMLAAVRIFRTDRYDDDSW